jgi:bifunctional UDP-N-acetylglucosamine pyrophosphorylase / glucosamine-1-phosphate N-acetyltransferase
MNTAAVILAAGQGTRMKSALPKVLHPILGKPMLWYAIQAARAATGADPVLVVGYGAQAVQAAIGDQARYALQEQQLGTGHAVLQAAEMLRGTAEQVLVITGDMPLMQADTLARLVQAQASHPGPLTMSSVISADSHGFGRVVRGTDSTVQAIVEEAQASPEQLAIQELNASAYCFQAEWLWETLPHIPISPKGEYYLTDIVGIAVAEGLPVQALVMDDLQEFTGINTRIHLAEATAILHRRINAAWMLSGVTMVDPEAVYIEPGVQIGQDTLIWPGTYLRGETRIGASCELGPNAIITDSTVGDRSKVLASVLTKAVVEEDVDIGPFGHLRKGAHLAQGVHMGNFGEIKNSYLGPGTKMGHFSYIGDAQIEAEVNIGAGTITCNYDGKRKHATEIGAGAFIGSDTMLVAPVRIGKNARTGAGSVVTKNVPDDALAVGVPARVVRKVEKKD